MTTLPWVRWARLALATLLAVVSFGALGYVLIERWTLFDALYMAVITLSTVGYGEVHPLTGAGRGFTIIFIGAGRLAEAYVLIVFTQLIVVRPIREALEHRRMTRELEHLSNHHIVCGWGRMGQEIAEAFRRQRAPFVVVEVSEERCAQIAEQGILYIQGDAAEDEVLLKAGVRRARSLVAVAATDAQNIFITLSARTLSRDLFIVARSIHEHDAHKLEIAGANRVISPYVIGARRIAAAVFHPAVVDFLDQDVRHEELDWELEEVEITPRAAFAGKSLRESGIREETGCTVLAVRESATSGFHNNPPPEKLLQAGDTLIVLGTAEQLRKLQAHAGAS